VEVLSARTLLSVAVLMVEVSMRGFTTNLEKKKFLFAGVSASGVMEVYVVYRRPLTPVGAYVLRVDILALEGPAHRLTPPPFRIHEHVTHLCSRGVDTWEHTYLLPERLVPHGGE